jgi:hypothetical protein
MQDDREDLDDVMKEEKSRGRRPIDTDVQRERQLLRQGFLKLIQGGDERQCLMAIRGLGLQDGSPELEMILKLWREICERRKRSS